MTKDLHILMVDDGDVTILRARQDRCPSAGWTIRTRQNDYADLELQRGSVLRTYRISHTIDAQHCEARLLKEVGTAVRRTKEPRR